MLHFIVLKERAYGKDSYTIEWSLESRQTMSKKNKAVEVDIIETDRHKGDQVDLEVKVKKKTIGQIQKPSGQSQVSALMSSGKKRQVKSVDEAIQAIIAEYNLHDL